MEIYIDADGCPVVELTIAAAFENGLKGYIVITQDYGLAAMCIVRDTIPINPNGFVYTNKNIDNMLFKRYVSRQIRRAGGKTPNMRKRKSIDNENFKKCLLEVIRKNIKCD